MASPTASGAVGAVWTTSNGRSWSLAELGGSGSITVAADGSRFLALGETDGWTSTNGTTWNAVAAPSGGAGAIVGLPAGGFLAARGSSDGSSCSLWFSATGASWQKRVAPHAGPCPSALAIGPDGLVAAGASSTGMGWLAFSGTLGKSWTTEVSGVATRFTTVAAVNGGFLATSEAYGSRGQTWRSPDGLDWRRVGTFGVRSAYLSTRIDAIVRFHDRFFAFGDSATGDSTYAEAWSSPSGATWTSWRVPHENYALAGATVWNDRLIAVGRDNTEIFIGDEPLRNNAIVFVGRPG